MTADRLIAGRYRLSEPIGTGAMGVVWRATDTRLRRTVAVKQLLLAPGLTRSQALEAKLRAMREGRIAARLHHQNAVTVFDVAEEDGQPWLVMEFVEAPSLAALMREKGTLAPQEVARIGAKVAAALSAAHDAGIVHRDVKPANILVADDGTVKITDFGISRAVGDVTVTSTGFLAGTPAYLAPEVARGDSPEPASDVFALGSTLYAAVQGAPPFGEGDNPLAVLHAVARAQIPEPRRAGTLGPVLMDLLAAEPAQRPSMRQAQQAMEEVAEGRMSTATKTPAKTRILPVSALAVDAAEPTTVLAAERSGIPVANADDKTTRVATGGTVPPARPGGGTMPVGPPASQPNSLNGLLQNRRAMVVIGAAVVVVLVVVGLVVGLGGGNHGGSNQAAGQSSAVHAPVAPAPSSAGGAQSQSGGASSGPTADSSGGGQDSSAPSTSAAPSTGAAPSSVAPGAAPSAPAQSSTAPAPPPPAPQPVDPAGFVSSYYGMLPNDPNGAWAMLSPSYQAETGGLDSYVNFWSQFSSVSVSNFQPNGNNIDATVTYTYKSGGTTSEQRWFQVDSSGGHPEIAASEIG